jgi:hypothetical protein
MSHPTGCSGFSLASLTAELDRPPATVRAECNWGGGFNDGYRGRIRGRGGAFGSALVPGRNRSLMLSPDRKREGRPHGRSMPEKIQQEPFCLRSASPARARRYRPSCRRRGPAQPELNIIRLRLTLRVSYKLFQSQIGAATSLRQRPPRELRSKKNVLASWCC